MTTIAQIAHEASALQQRLEQENEQTQLEQVSLLRLVNETKTHVNQLLDALAQQINTTMAARQNAIDAAIYGDNANVKRLRA